MKCYANVIRFKLQNANGNMFEDKTFPYYSLPLQ